MTEMNGQQCTECTRRVSPGFDVCLLHGGAGSGPRRTGGSPTGTGAMVCPHCQTRGTVTTQPVKVKRGVSGGKLTGALLTGGLSMLGTGLSRKERVTQASCSNCGASWSF